VVTIDTPLTDPQIAAASAAFDRLLPFQEPKEGEKPRYRYSLTCSYFVRKSWKSFSILFSRRWPRRRSAPTRCTSSRPPS